MYKGFKWFITGVAFAILISWVSRGGFSHFTEVQIIIMLVTVGLAAGLWFADWLNRGK